MRGQPKAKAGTLWGMTYILMGLRYAPLLVSKLLEGVIAMEESSTYQVILAKGKAEGKAEGMTEGALEEARKTLLLLGREQFGVPNARVKEAIKAIGDLARLEQLQVRLLKVQSWEELLDLPRRASGRRKKPS